MAGLSAPLGSLTLRDASGVDATERAMALIREQKLY